MKHRDRVRRTALLCLHCLANVAAYRAGWAESEHHLYVKRDFWVRANGNFFDLAILEWCKLFVDRNGKHHWSRVFKDKAEFRNDLFINLHLSELEFRAQFSIIRNYRNKFVAHLDELAHAQLPLTSVIKESAAHLYTRLANEAATKEFLIGAPWDAEAYYQDRVANAVKEYQAALDP